MPFGDVTDALAACRRSYSSPVTTQQASRRYARGPTRQHRSVDSGQSTEIKVRKITDGTANTVMLSEILSIDGHGAQPDWSDAIRGVWVSVGIDAARKAT